MKFSSGNRQNRRTMLTCHFGLLQILLHQVSRLADSTTLGTEWPGESCAAGQVRGRVADATSSGYQPGSMCSRDTRCWPHADCEREPDCARNTGTKEYCGRSYRAVEAALDLLRNGNAMVLECTGEYLFL